jgi:hypothetical protein
MPWSVDNVDLRPFPTDGGVLRQDGDAALPLERIRVHHSFLNDLILAKGAGLPQHFIDERRLAVIDVRNDSNVPDLHSRST